MQRAGVMADNSGATNTESPEDLVRRLLAAEDSVKGPPTGAHKRPLPRANVVPSLASRFAKIAGHPFSAVSGPVRSATKSYRPTPRYAALVMLAVLTVIKPWLVTTLALLTLFLALVSYLTLGPDRSGEILAAWFARFLQRDPLGAEKLRARAERVSARATVILGCLPERWTSGLYLPDFSLNADRQDFPASDPFDRLTSPEQDR